MMTKFYLVQRTLDGDGGSLVVSLKAFATKEEAERFAKLQQEDLMSAVAAKVEGTGRTLLDFLKSFGVGGIGHPIMEVPVHEAHIHGLSIVRPS